MINIYEKTINLCNKYDIKPARSKGQNFLINEKVYDDIVDAANIEKDDIVLEVGPGLGFLTEKLAKFAKKIIAVELDDKLAEVLKKRLKEQQIKNVEILNMNILDFSGLSGPTAKALAVGPLKVVANLPYNITSVFLRKFLTTSRKPESMTLMLQKEVAERIAAKPGKMSLLAVSVQFYAKPELLFKVPSNDFYPAPKVDSAVINIKVAKPNRFVLDENNFFRLVKHGFSSKRKMLKNNLSAGLHIAQEDVVKVLREAGFNEKVRAQELSLDDWVKIYSFFNK